MRHLTLAKGGDADLLSMTGDQIVLSSSLPFPPGARFDATLGTGEAVQLKSHGSHKEEDGRFTVKGRVISPTRALRETLASLAAGKSGG